MQQEAIDVGMQQYRVFIFKADSWHMPPAQEAMGKFTIEKDIAQHIKKTVCMI